MRGERLQSLLAHLGQYLLARRSASRASPAPRRERKQVRSRQSRSPLGDEPGDRGIGWPRRRETSDLATVLGHNEGLSLLDLTQKSGQVLT
jgi:hypothetical protein